MYIPMLVRVGSLRKINFGLGMKTLSMKCVDVLC